MTKLGSCLFCGKDSMRISREEFQWIFWCKSEKCNYEISYQRPDFEEEPTQAVIEFNTRYQSEDEVVMTKEWFHKYQAAYILQEMMMGNVGKIVCRCGVEDCPDMLDMDHYKESED